MKTHIIFLLAIVIPIFGLTQTADQLLKEAIYKEEVAGDLEEAIRLYHKIIDEHKELRPIAAEATFRLGLTNEKLGRDMAISFYQMVVEQYADQSSLVNLAKQRLSYLTEPQADPETKAGISFLSNTKLATLEDIYGTISHDGRYISYVDWANNGNLAIYNVRESVGQILTDEGSWAGEYQFSDWSIWSPDDQKIAYVWYKGNVPELRIWDIEKGEYFKAPKRIPESGIVPLFLDSGDRFYYQECGDDCIPLSIRVMDLNEDREEILWVPTNDEKEKMTAVRLSPSLDKLAVLYSGNDELSNMHVHEFPDGESPVVKIEDIVGKPLWSNNGDLLYYAKEKYGNKALYRQRFEHKSPVGPEEIILESLPNDFSLSSLNPNTGDLHYKTTRGIGIIEKRNINWSNNRFGSPEVLIDSDKSHYQPTWSPDGDKFAFIARPGGGKYDRKLMIWTNKSEQPVEVGKNIRLLEPQIEWTSDGGSIGFRFKPMISTNAGDLSLGIMDLQTEKIRQYSYNELGVQATAILSNHQILTFVQGEGIYIYNLKNKEKNLIYKNENTKHSIWYMSPNSDGTEIVFFEGDRYSSPWIKRLIHVDLETGTKKVLWEPSDQWRFSPRTAPQWLKSGTGLLVAMENKEKNIQQFYTIGLDSRDRKSIGEPIPIDKKWTNTSLHPSGESIIYARQQGEVSAWTIRNIPD